MVIPYRSSTRFQVSYVSGNRTCVSSVKMRASGAILSSRSRTTDASFWNEQATASRGWKRSTMYASTPLASRPSRSGVTRVAASAIPEMY